ncbi:heme exporter protein CcmD [Woodsholea maritima]|uniref:heme exporter protein CcmD n=1 Tax=Woodsholea maritima TaxID=240237 RepID=UPI00036E6525|nr:heme exporter protein CcmD [Woodsholea maritima]
MSTWLAMDGYGVFVWASYGLTAGVTGALILLSMLRHAKAKAHLADLQAEIEGL